MAARVDPRGMLSLGLRCHAEAARSRQPETGATDAPAVGYPTLAAPETTARSAVAFSLAARSFRSL